MLNRPTNHNFSEIAAWHHDRAYKLPFQLDFLRSPKADAKFIASHRKNWYRLTKAEKAGYNYFYYKQKFWDIVEGTDYAESGKFSKPKDMEYALIGALGAGMVWAQGEKRKSQSLIPFTAKKHKHSSEVPFSDKPVPQITPEPRIEWLPPNSQPPTRRPTQPPTTEPPVAMDLDDQILMKGYAKKGRKRSRKMSRKGKRKSRRSRKKRVVTKRQVYKQIMSVSNPLRTFRSERNFSIDVVSNIHGYYVMDLVRKTSPTSEMQCDAFLAPDHLERVAAYCGITPQRNGKYWCQNMKRSYELVNCGQTRVYITLYRAYSRNDLESQDLFAQFDAMLDEDSTSIVDTETGSYKPFGVSNATHMAFDYIPTANSGANFQNTSIFESGKIRKTLSKGFIIKKMGNLILEANQHTGWSKIKKSYTWDPYKYTGVATQSDVFRHVSSWDFIEVWGENTTQRTSAATAPNFYNLEGPVHLSVNVKDSGRVCSKMAVPEYDYFHVPTVNKFVVAAASGTVGPVVTSTAPSFATDITQGAAGYATGDQSIAPSSVI